MEWRHRAACGGDLDRFEADATGQAGKYKAGRAMHVCLSHCPVLAECAAWSSRHDWFQIVVGGVHYGQDSRPVRRTQSTADGCAICGGRS